MERHHAPVRIVWESSALLPPRTGVGRYAFELARALRAVAPQHGLHLAWRSVRRTLAAEDREALAGAVTHEGRVPPGPVLMWLWARGWGPAIERLTGPADIVHGVAGLLPPSRARARVVTIHDLHFLRAPGSGHALGGRLLARHLPRIAAGLRRVIVPSEATARDCEELLGIPRERIAVIPHGGAEVFRREPDAGDWRRYGDLLEPRCGEHFWLFVGGDEPRKNLALAERACRRAGEARSEPQTLFTVPMSRARRVTGEGPRRRRYVRLPIDDALLRCLLRRARGLLVPSLAEGFGLPILEAMAAGCPVICSDIPVFREVTGGHARFFDPRREDQLVAQIQAALDDPGGERSRAARAREHIAPFTWDRTARHTLSVYGEALAP